MNCATRRHCVRLMVSAPVLPLATYARAKARRRIGLLGMTSAAGYAVRWGAFRQGLQTLGWMEGQQIEFVERYADGRLERMPAQAAELVAAKAEVLVTHGIAGGQAARQATKTVPIVLAVVADPVAAGLVASYARPGGNITGSAFLAKEMAAKRMQLLKEALPRATRVAVLSNPKNPLFSQAMFDAMQGTAGPLGLTLQRHDVTEPSQFARVFEDIVAHKADASGGN